MKSPLEVLHIDNTNLAYPLQVSWRKMNSSQNVIVHAIHGVLESTYMKKIVRKLDFIFISNETNWYYNQKSYMTLSNMNSMGVYK